MRRRRRSGFTLIEILVVVAILAILVAMLLPSLRAARESGRGAVCVSNLRQSFLACRMYADTHRGFSPAIGAPYDNLPNWALQVQAYCARYRPAGTAMYRPESVLVCPTIRAFYQQDMTRTYAMNATGHAGLPGDPDNYELAPSHIRLDKVRNPADTLLLLDSAKAPMTGTGPPSLRTASMIDFRQPDHVLYRLGQFHSAGKRFNIAYVDGSVRSCLKPLSRWEQPLP